MLTVYGRADSSNVQAVMWCIAELGLSYHRHDIGHRFGGTDTPEFIAMNPNRTVPVLVDSSGPAIWESGAILRYLSNRYATAPFWPSDPSDRAQIDKWAEWSKISVATNFTVPIFWALVRTPSAKRNYDALQQAVLKFEDRLKIADHQLSRNEYLAGNYFSLADISLGHILYRYFDIDITRADLPNLRAYYDRLAQRALYQTHVMISYEALRE